MLISGLWSAKFQHSADLFLLLFWSCIYWWGWKVVSVFCQLIPLFPCWFFANRWWPTLLHRKSELVLVWPRCLWLKFNFETYAGIHIITLFFIICFITYYTFITDFFTPRYLYSSSIERWKHFQLSIRVMSSGCGICPRFACIKLHFFLSNVILKFQKTLPLFSNQILPLPYSCIKLKIIHTQQLVYFHIWFFGDCILIII